MQAAVQPLAQQLIKVVFGVDELMTNIAHPQYRGIILQVPESECPC
jgi:hypothetical protein